MNGRSMFDDVMGGVQTTGKRLSGMARKMADTRGGAEPVICDACGASLRSIARFCDQCGKPVTPRRLPETKKEESLFSPEDFDFLNDAEPAPVPAARKAETAFSPEDFDFLEEDTAPSLPEPEDAFDLSSIDFLSSDFMLPPLKSEGKESLFDPEDFSF